MTFLDLPRILALLGTLAVIVESSLMVRDNWRSQRALLVARLVSRLFKIGVLVYFVVAGPPPSPKGAMLMVSLLAYFSAETIYRIASRQIEKDKGSVSMFSRATQGE